MKSAGEYNAYLFSEFASTFLLTLCWSAAIESEDPTAKPLKVNHFTGLALQFTIICIFQKISCDMNPAVTLLFLFNETDRDLIRRRKAMFIDYIFMQFLGGFLGFEFSYFFNGGKVLRINIADGYSLGHGFFMELFATTIIFVFVLVQSYHSHIFSHDDIIKNLVVISGVATGISFGGNVTAAAMNPVMGLMPTIVRAIHFNEFEPLSNVWI
jgi:glycerol uptake facilitator-like aquaporin